MWTSTFLSSQRLKTSAPLLLFLSSIARESLRDERAPSTVPFKLSVDLAQIVFSLFLYLLARTKPSNSYGLLGPDKDGDEESIAMDGPHAPLDSIHDATIPTGSIRFNLLGGAIGALYAIQAFIDEESAKIKNLTELHVMFPVCTLVLLLYLRLAFGRSVESNSWSLVALQFCGSYMVKSTVSARFSQTNIPTLAAFAVVSALAFITSYYTFRHLDRSLASFARLTVVIFIAKLAVAVAVTGVNGFSSSRKDFSEALPRRFDLVEAILFLSECCRGICMLMTLHSHDVVVVSVLLTSANIVWLAATALFAHLLAFGVLGGCSVALVASYLYIRNDQQSDAMSRESFKPRRFFGIASFLIIVLLGSHAFQRAEKTEYPPSVSQLFRFEAIHPNCYPRKEPASLRPLWESDYHEFDNVLLVVFFSHARYDVNLDFWKEAYSKYFPNVVFLGPASREDSGFRHSFDVVVNSYQSDENTTYSSGLPTKMSGRMAHHMLYQALAENDCGYDGYLWAPFDTLLNVPRLQQFDKSRFWYHSPWAQYVPNPASTLSAQDTPRHAPPATISPDPYPKNPEDVYKENWWWGSREYGLGVCMPAFEKVPLRMRERLAEYTNGETRLVGGSSDTMYIPGQHAEAFRETLGIFLETSCFLEIATPTTLHLVAPPEEPILFVDHYWIWYPPFNATFVRQKWAEGYEVDTFHTFHWGDGDANGVWRAHPGIVEDVRRVLEESAARQGITWQ